MPDTELVSHAQHGEDVVLWRALGAVTPGRYLEVGAHHPSDLSVSRAFYDRGWSGVVVAPVGTFETLHREQRPRDRYVRAALTEQETDRPAGDDAGRDAEDGVPARRLDAVLDEAGLAGADIHFMTIDLQGDERPVLAGLDLTRRRPWVLVVRSPGSPSTGTSTAPSHGAPEPALPPAGYTFCQFDGVNRWYVADEHAERLLPALSYPACPLDRYVRADVAAARADVERLTRARDTAMDALLEWRAAAVRQWAGLDVDGGLGSTAERDELRRVVAELSHELQAIRATLSWRVTAPLRAVSRLVHRGA